MASVPRVRLALGVLALAACVDTQAPDTPSLEPSFKKSPLPAIATAKVDPADLAEAGGNPFNITLRFLTTVPFPIKREFRLAARRWQGIIVRDVPSITGVIPRNTCGPFGTPRFSGTIDDILIDVLVQPIDGPGGILGAAGPCAIRTADDLPAYGLMFFDSEDLDFIASFDILTEVIIHEMGHVLGFGTLWNFNRALLLGDGTNHPRFDGRQAKREWHQLGGVGRVVVEEGFGPGTAFSHWDEETFDTELMTGFIALGESPLSNLSVRSMQDLGYGVAATGDPYELPSLTAAGAQTAAARGPVQGLDMRTGERLLRPSFRIE